MTLQIRSLEDDDRPGWTELWRGYLAFYETELPDEIFDAQWARLMSVASIDGLLALDDDRPVGLAHYMFHDHGWKLSPVCYMQDLFTTPDARGKGVGRALIEGVYAQADATGARDVYWLTADDNHVARRLYDRVGTLTPFVKYTRT